jgi:hypothetical protein
VQRDTAVPGAATGSPEILTYSVDPVSGRNPDLIDVLRATSEAQFLEVLSAVVSRWQMTEWDTACGDTVSATTPISRDYIAGWLPATDGLTVWLKKYSVAPGAAGIPTFTIPWSDIANPTAALTREPVPCIDPASPSGSTAGGDTGATPVTVVASCEGDSGLEADNRTVTTLAGANLTDGYWDTAWRCTYRADSTDVRSPWVPEWSRAVGEQVTFTFPNPVTINRIGVMNGYLKQDPSSGADRYRENGKATQLQWEFDGDSANPVTQDLPAQASVSDALALGPSWLYLDVPRTVSQVTMTVLDVSPGSRGDIKGSAAISEVIFE